MENYDEVGQVVTTHGLKGEVKVMVTTDFPKERFKKGATLFVKRPDGWQPLHVASARVHKGMYLLTFTEYTDIDEVQFLRQQKLWVNESDQHELAAGEYYYRDIVGMTIIDQATNEAIGKVREILSPGANDVWVVARPGQKDLLLPFLKTVMLKIDVEHQTTLVDIPEGLDD
ncbi:16S rRNA processing protein RimM [Lapidilactobacillus concavus DSM 17758]|uniref:Ribosome maturation factor RimM n=1 Tax=Lapidilactobacillus concavus DSM 17758 TaxID=1423735 RepID=A0A0R1W8I4_9LACO|nr:ribosome maturation factor RimM [Lapidilactobacillus concavus]KRM13797.1 16S rRNA processing protein RimM [Lapidilactobacillus concavus DSM 17758]GEL12680.1 ribosome maturation factor RimM [Lapidilactobacillus concavus]